MPRSPILNEMKTLIKFGFSLLMGACFLTESRAHNIIPKPQSIVMGQGSIAVSQLNAAQTNLKGEDFAPVSYTHLTLPTNREV